ncbi:MAG: hypothetical protein VX910_13335 [Candidatus Latescibacterota bacterium]|nr:hypothetical protein [Candidatus Latescibacterota bacterium]
MNADLVGNLSREAYRTQEHGAEKRKHTTYYVENEDVTTQMTRDVSSIGSTGRPFGQ